MASINQNNCCTVRGVRFIIVQLSGWKNAEGYAGAGAEMGSPAFYVKPRDKWRVCVSMRRTGLIVQINEGEGD